MAIQLPPPPTEAVSDSYNWREWFYTLWSKTTSSSGISFNSLDFSGSNINSIVTRDHNTLTNLQGGTSLQYYHLNQAQYNQVSGFFNYGVFIDTTTQTAAATGTAYTFTWNTTVSSVNVSRGTPTSRIVCAKAGVYNFQFSLEAEKTNASAGTLYVWYRINGVDIANSGTKFTLSGSAADSVPAWNFVQSMNANDYFELVWSVDATDIKIETYAASSPVPAIPSGILTVTQVA